MFVQKVFEKKFNFWYQKGKIKANNYNNVISTLKIEITIVPLFFQLVYLLVPKIEICVKYFGQKLPKAAIVIWEMAPE
jgi:hypothetical protein